MSRLSQLERKGALQLLVTLLRKPDHSALMNEATRAVGIHHETLMALVDFLEEIGLVKQEKTATFPQRHIITLTEQGLAVAQHLIKVAENLKHQ